MKPNSFSAFECVRKGEEHHFEPTGDIMLFPERRIVYECIKCSMQVSEAKELE